MWHKVLVMTGMVRDERAGNLNAWAIALWLVLVAVLTFLSIKYI
jgi:hypothetical protein